MKNKPTRHKETNTFKFKRFSERVSEIDVDVFHRVAHRYEEQSADGSETFFHQTLQKWNVLNLTEGYTALKKEVRSIVTLPQLLNRKEEVVGTLSKYLKNEDNQSYLQPVLELIVAVARDLQKDFYEYFPSFLETIIRLLETKDAERLEMVFTSLAYLFKFLWRYLIRNVDRTFDLLLPLLAESKPSYVNNFAAESFAYVVRKVRDRDSFFRLVLETLREKRDGINGCGRLMFEVISGTNGRFHSCAESMLTLYLRALEDDKIDGEIVDKVLEKIFDCVLEEIDPQQSQVFWRVLLKFIDRWNESELRKEDSEKIVSLYRLIRRAIDHRNGRMLTNPLELIKKIVRSVEVWEKDEETLRSIIDVSATILTASGVKISQENSSQLVLKLLSMSDKRLIFYSVEKLLNFASFENLVLPNILGRTVRGENFDEETLNLLARISYSRSPPCLDGFSGKNWKKFPIDFRGASSSAIDFIGESLEETTRLGKPMENTFKTLTILPHLTPIPEVYLESLKSLVRTTFLKIEQENSSTDEDKETEKWNFLFLLSIDTATRIFRATDFHDLIDTLDSNVLNILKQTRKSKILINAIDSIYNCISDSDRAGDFLTIERFDETNDLLAEELSSPFRSTRLTVSHIYWLFRNVKETKISPEAKEDSSALEIMFLAEKEAATIEKYRDRLVHLGALNFQSNAIKNLKEKYQEIALRYLLGNLWINFSLLWDPVCKAIATYFAKDGSRFWQIFLSRLKIEASPKNLSMNLFQADKNSRQVFQFGITNSSMERIFLNEDKPDGWNYKLLLWKCMEEFVEYCETKNRDITGLFIENVESNYFKSNTENARTWSIEKRIKETEIEEEEEEEEEDSEEEEEEEEKEERSKNKSLKKGKEKMGEKRMEIKLLLAQLKLFSKMNNPRTLYREPEMNRIYLDLLQSKNVEMQKSALDCLVSYKEKYLLAYKENLYSLVDEKNLKNELASFRIDADSAILKKEDRQGLMPILMRLLYAKMVMKIGTRTGGKNGGMVRRKTILRFLAGSEEEEMLLFTKMAFKPFDKYLSLEKSSKELDLRLLIEDVKKNLDLSNVVPPRRLRSSVNLLSLIIEQFGGRMMENLLPRLLSILICATAQASEILSRSVKVLTGYLPTLKNVRTTCLNVLERFFKHFENYPWKAEELDAIFQAAVFPVLEKLPIEGIHSPTALLRLFGAWSENPRYYKLLIKHDVDNSSLTPLPFVMQLFLGKKTHASVINFILEMLEKMLTLRDTDDKETEAEESSARNELTVNDLLAIEDNASGEMNYGSRILKPHVPEILRYMKDKLERTSKGIKRQELLILSRLSELSKEPETSDELLRLLLPILVRRTSRGGGEDEEETKDLLTTMINLVKNVEKPEIHLSSMVGLLSTVTSVPGRKLLLRLIGEVSSSSDEKNCQLLTKLNAWDKKWIEQADFDERLEAFRRINDWIESAKREDEAEEISVEFGAAILHNCYYFLSHETDLALRDSAGECLKKLGAKLGRICKEDDRKRRYLIEDTILNLAKKGIRSKSETLRNQCLGLLREMSLECSDVHPVFRDLFLLTNKQDPEVDFFENLQHLQLHRRARALLRFSSLARTLKKYPNTKTLTQFLFPIASSYLCNESYAKKNSIVDAAIEAVGTICNLLPWHHYELILKHYLDKLGGPVEFQRQVVRIIVAILDAFHYDLSKLASTDTPEAEVQVEEKEEEAEEESLEEILSELRAEEPEAGKETCEEKSVMEKKITLSKYMSKRLVSGITNVLLPKLHRSIVAKTNWDNSHKLNRRKIGSDKEDEELTRVPIALAMIKLLQKLPEDVLERNVASIFMKLCNFLKSRLDSVRRVTREIICKIMTTLGPKYLHYFLKESNAILTKGYQIHVLAYTIHSILAACKDSFDEKDMSENLSSIKSVCRMDLFGSTGDEKEVAAIGKNLFEARATKSYDIYFIIGQLINESCLLDVVLPLREMLLETRSHRTVKKIVECLRNFLLGLADNNFIQVDRIVIFIYGIISNQIPEVLSSKNQDSSEENDGRFSKNDKPDCFIIQPEPKTRMGFKKVAKVSSDTNSHVMLEFALKLFHVLLKREKIHSTLHKIYLEPFVPILANSLDAKSVKMTTLALQCLNRILRMDLEKLRECLKEICGSIFAILHKYAAAGLSKGDNFDLVMAAFKCMSVLVRDVKYYNITSDETKALVLYAEQDLHDGDKRATAFNLLKSIISRKLMVPEMHAVMEKVATLSVTSNLDHIRQQSRSLFYSYLIKYPLGKQLDKHLSFYLSQLSYEMKPGRLSALEMIHAVVTGFPVEILLKQSGMMFVMIGVRLINDEDPGCRKLCAKCIKEIITRIPHNDRVKLFDIVKLWLKDPKITHRTLAAQLCGIFVSVEKESFDSRLREVLPLILDQFKAKDSESLSKEDGPGRFVRLEKKMKRKCCDVEQEPEIKDPERMKDHHLFQVFQLSLKITANCQSLFKDDDYEDSVRLLAEYSQSNLAHPHLWVRLAASQLIGFVLSNLKEEKITNLLENPEKTIEEKCYIYSNPTETLRSLSLDLVAQLQPEMEFEELADQVVKNLVFIARVIKSLRMKKSEEEEEEEEAEMDEKKWSKKLEKISILWLIRRVRKCINVEITQSPKSTCVRMAAFKWIGGILATIPMEYLRPYLFQIMSPLVREIATIEESNAPLRQLGKEVATMIKKNIGNEDYAKLFVRVQQKLESRKNERRIIRKRQSVVDPETEAKRKMAKQLKKKESRKRRMNVMKGKRTGSKRARKEVDLETM